MISPTHTLSNKPYNVSSKSKQISLPSQRYLRIHLCTAQAFEFKKAQIEGYENEDSTEKDLKIQDLQSKIKELLSTIEKLKEELNKKEDK